MPKNIPKAWQFSIKIEVYMGIVGLENDNVIIGLVSKIITNDNKGTYLVKSDQKYDNVIYEWSLATTSRLIILCLLFCCIVLLYCCRPFPKKVVSE